MLAVNKTKMTLKKYLLGLLFLVLLSSACSSTKIFLVRHGEKSTYPSNDPYLTAAGKARAQALAATLSKESIQAIYSTNTNRTRETATPLSLKRGLALQIYATDTASSMMKHLLASKKNTLIVGHSNTLLPLIRSLGLTSSLTEIADFEYDHLFIISHKGGKTTLQERRYGKPSPKNTDTIGIKTMQ